MKNVLIHFNSLVLFFPKFKSKEKTLFSFSENKDCLPIRWWTLMHTHSDDANHTNVNNILRLTRCLAVPGWCEKNESHEKEAGYSVFMLDEICVCLSSSCPGWVLHYKVLSPNCQNQLTWIMNVFWRGWSWVFILFKLPLFQHVQENSLILQQVQEANFFYRYEVGPKIFLKAPDAPKKLQTTKKTLHSPSPQQLNVALKRDLIHMEKECNPLHQETLMALVAPLISLYPLHHP